MAVSYTERPLTAFAHASASMQSLQATGRPGSGSVGPGVPPRLTLSPPRQLPGGSRVHTAAGEDARQQASWGRAMHAIDGAWSVVAPLSAGETAAGADADGAGGGGGGNWFADVGDDPRLSAEGRRFSQPQQVFGAHPIARSATAPTPSDRSNSHRSHPLGGSGGLAGGPGLSTQGAGRRYNAAHLQGHLRVPRGCPPHVEKVLREKLGVQIL